MPRLVIPALLACLVVLGVAVPALASAHAELVSSDPASGAVLTAAPDRITLVFSEPVSAESAEVGVTGQDGKAWQPRSVRVNGNSLVVQLDPATARTGVTTASWRVRSEDGHDATGKVAFRLDLGDDGQTGAGEPNSPGEQQSAAPTLFSTGESPTIGSTVDNRAGNENEDMPAWLWIGVGAVIVLGFALVAVLRGRDDNQAKPRKRG
ncbi:copper resistance protein CopC [Actinosynnema pretiosum subsp. pretiosum]|uniref:Copper resistance protein CopC n=2 Tax=Actinosynnema TaxID=40566 RepID=C6WCQ7_ACTMD|nr:copper resistance CopC family protein [Actinosynnema mirum]ACU35674.1 copper resistance protein CopC [Actinosynnema mirum DSM 43827]QUF06623.1 copper resistance protein CopC [Actinosynnema pretiosum subsp. pretiosum]